MSARAIANGSEQEALDSRAARAVARLAQALLSVRPLVHAMTGPVRVAAMTEGQPTGAGDAAGLGTMAALLQRMTARLGMRELALQPGTPAGFTSFELVVSSRLALGADHWAGLSLPGATPDVAQGAAGGADGAVERIVDDVVAQSLQAAVSSVDVSSFDGARVRAYAGGMPGGKAVIIVSACGMPVDLSEGWLRHLMRSYRVLTWESRGLFGDSGDFDAVSHDVDAQAGDLLAVMDHFGVERAHLMGLCGGAVVAVTAAARSPERVSSLSLWHGDFELGAACPKTTHQQDVKQVMMMAGKSRGQAASLHKLFCRPSVLQSTRADVAHLVLYPYASGELLFRYGRLNGDIMDTNVEPLLPRVGQPTLVVTSEDDTTAHPAGSRHVAARLARATFHVEPHGDHLSVFDAEPRITRLASQFIERETL
jgi:3-oxoadipate enol-lactonase